MPNLPDYRFYFFANDGHIERRIDLNFESDEDAIAHAKVIGSKHGIEIWEGNRKVREVLP